MLFHHSAAQAVKERVIVTHFTKKNIVCEHKL